jgi:carbonic anhydrase
MTPAEAIQRLKDGNRRFVTDALLDRPWSEHVAATAEGQYPFAAVLGCIDSRVPVEKVFDQGLGDLLTARVAGNVVNADVLGSLEFACRIAGSKVVVVLGHTSCGAVKGAIDQVELGNLTGLLGKIRPAIEAAGNRSRDEDYVAELNVGRSIDAIRHGSPVLAEMEQQGEIVICGAMYDLGTGEVRFL